MTQSAMTGCGGTINVSTASTSWYTSFGAQAPNLNTTESDVQVAFRCGTPTLQNFRCYVGTNTRAQNSTANLSKNGSNTSMPTVTITGSTVGTFSDLSTQATIADTDKMTIVLTTGTSTGNVQITGLSLEVVSSGQSATPVSVSGSQANSVGRFYPLAGLMPSLLEASALQAGVEASSVTVRNMQFVITANASTGWTSTSRKNSAAGGQSVVVGSGATGLFEDTSGSDSIAAGDTYDFSKPAISGSATLTCVSMKYIGSAAGQVSLNSASNSTLASGTTRYLPVFGTLLISAEASAQTPAAFAGTSSRLAVYIQTNSSAAGTTVVFRNGGATKTQSVALGTSTGFLQDTSNQDPVAAGDLINYMASGSNNNVTFDSASSQMAANAATASGGLLLLGVGS